MLRKLFGSSVVLLLLAALLPAVAGAQGSAITPIYEIQGEGHISPFDGQVVETHGVVTAVGFRTLYLQDPNGDGNDATSDGINVGWTGGQDSTWNVFDVGDCIEFSGSPSEFIGGGASTGNLSITNFFFFAPATPTLVDCETTFGSGYSFPDPVVIGESGRIAPNEITISDDEIDPPINLQDPTEDAANNFDPDEDAIDFYESLEGMLVTIEDGVAVSATRRFGTSSAEFWTLPNQGSRKIIEPNRARTARGGIQIQADADGYGDLNPERIQVQLDGNIYPEGGSFPTFTGLDLQVKVGDTVGDVTGVVGYSFGNFEVIATEVIDVVDGGLTEETTKLEGNRNRLLFASYNVLNLSAAEAAGDDAQFAKLGEQIVNNLNSPDVVALQEIGDDNGSFDDQGLDPDTAPLDGVVTAQETLDMLVASIAAAGGPAYEWFNIDPVDGTQGGAPGGNIRNAFLYNPDRVDLLGYTALDANLLSTIGADPTSFDGTRIPLIGLFRFDDTVFTAVSVHNSSRFGSTPIFGGPQPFVQAGEAEREAQNKALNAYVDFLLEGDKNAQVIVAGDFNTFEFTDEMTEDLPGDDRVLRNLINRGKRDDTYSFIFDGNSQMLDHIYVTKRLRNGAKFDVVHVNVDFPRTFVDVTASDHEPLLAVLRPKKAKRTDYTLSVLHNNDGESQLINAGTGIEDFGGVARFATVVANEKAAAESCDLGRNRKCGSLFVSSGDNFLAGPEFNASVANDEWYDAMALDMLGYDAISLGNHDFDFGPETLARFISEGFETPGMPPYLGANLDFSAEPALQALADDGVIVGSTVVTEDRESFGIVGAITPDLPLISSPGDTVIDPNLTAVVQAEIDTLLANKVDKIIFISHLQGVDEDIALAATLRGVDVMVAGGGDEVLARPGDALVPGDTPFGHYPLLAFDNVGNYVPVVTTAGDYKYLGDLEINWDRKGNVVSWSGGPIRVAGGANPDAVAADPVFQSEIVDPVAAYVADLGANVIATSEVALEGRRDPGIRTEETNLGNLMADSLRWQADQNNEAFGVPDPDVAIQNGGGIRNNNLIPAGPITELNTFEIAPFSNFVTITEDVPRDQFRQILERAVSGAPGAEGRFAQVSGFSFTYDTDGTAQEIDADGNIIVPGTRVVEVTLDDGTEIVDGGAVQTGADLTVATIDFLAGGGDGYPFMGLPFTRLGASYQQALANYIEAPGGNGGLGGTITAADYPEGGEGRITEVP